MANQNECKFDLMRLTPELQVKVFEGVDSPPAAVDLALTCRTLNSLYFTYKKQIIAAIRDTMVAPFYGYYAFLSRLHIPESAIKHPPAGGWPNITPENCAEFGKSDFVVDVLRHLPYIVETDSNAHSIEYRCNVLDYSEATRADFAGLALKDGETRHEHSLGEIPISGHKVVIAKTWSREGVDLLLDTRAGVIIIETIRDEPEPETWPLREYFARKMRTCKELRQVFAPGGYANYAGVGPPGEREEEEEPCNDDTVMQKAGEPVDPRSHFTLNQQMDRDWVRHLYRRFGWPGEHWKKEEGLKAITEYIDRRNAEADERLAELRRKRDETLQRLGPVVGVLHCF